MIFVNLLGNICYNYLSQYNSRIKAENHNLHEDIRRYGRYGIYGIYRIYCALKHDFYLRERLCEIWNIYMIN